MTDPIIDFVNQYIQTEYEAIVADYLERDAQVFQQKLDALKPFLGEGIKPYVQRPSEVDDDYFADGEAIMASGSVHPRTLFQIKEYLAPPHPHLYRARSLYRVYLSLPRKSKKHGLSYVINDYIIPDGDARSAAFKIISEYQIDVSPDKRGLRMTTGGLTWDHRGGVKLHTLGVLVKCWKFQPPEDPAHRAEYEAE